MFYEVKINQSFLGNHFVNTLYYEYEGLLANSFVRKGADELAERVKAEIVPRLQAIQNSATWIESIRIQPFDDNFRLATLTPYELNVGVGGTGTEGDWLPVTQGILLKFNLAPSPKFDLLKQPHTGRMFISGLSEGWFDVGNLVESFGNEAIPMTKRWRLKKLCESLSKPLADGILPDWIDSGGFEPCRVRLLRIGKNPTNPNQSLIRFVGYAHVVDVKYSTKLWYNRARAKN